MDIKWFEDFISLVEHRSFTKAAEERHVTQSGLSRRIRSLECYLGVELVKKNVYPTTITDIGLTHTENIKAFISQYYILTEKIQESEKNGKALTISTQHALSVCFFPNWYKSLNYKKDNLSIRLQANDFHDSLLAFLEERTDFLLCYSNQEDFPALNRTDVLSIQIGTDELVPVSLKDSHYDSDTIPIPLVNYPDDTFFGKAIIRELKEKALSPHNFNLILETAMSDSIKSMVLQGAGMGWLPKGMVQDEIDSGVLTLVPDMPIIKMNIMLYRHKITENNDVLDVWDNITNKIRPKATLTIN